MPVLRHRNDAGDVRVHTFDRTIVIGRAADCDLVLDDAAVSRRHARIAPAGGRWTVEDLGSRAGTLVNRLPLSGSRLLDENDVIRIGASSLSFKSAPGETTGEMAVTLRAPVVGAIAGADDEPTAGGGAAAGEIVLEDGVEAGALMRTLRDTHAGSNAGHEQTEHLAALVAISEELRRCEDVQSVCEQCLELALRHAQADRGVIALLDPDGGAWDRRAESRRSGRGDDGSIRISETFVRMVVGNRVGLIAVDTEQQVDLAGAASVQAAGIRSILCAPLWHGDSILGWLYLDTIEGRHRFRREHLHLVNAIAYTAGAEIRARTAEMRRAHLSRFMAADVIRHIDDEARAGRLDPTRSAKEQVVTVLFADVRGFTAMAEDLPPAKVKALLDEYLDRMTGILIDRHGGTLDKYMGDGIMALFGAPFSNGVEEDARRAVSAALDMCAGVEEMRRSRPGFEAFSIRIGINTGRVIAGMLGSRRRMEYSVIGDAVNIASRLESSGEPGRVLVGEATWTAVHRHFVGAHAGERPVKNRAQPVRSWWIERARA